MEASTLGINRTGAAMSVEGTRAMIDASAELTPLGTIDTNLSKARRIQYITESDSVGSIPAPLSIKGAVKAGLAKVSGGHPTILLDKVGERLAYERTGVRLYDALITKYEALAGGEGTELPRATDVLKARSEGDAVVAAADESAQETLLRIRNEELAHFKLLTEAIRTLGGDPTSQTPCADVVGAASMGFMQVLTDPRTTLAQCLNVMLSVELTDNVGWELLIELADAAGESDLAGRFLAALGEEQEHMVIVRGWLEQLVTDGASTKAV